MKRECNKTNIANADKIFDTSGARGREHAASGAACEEMQRIETRRDEFKCEFISFAQLLLSFLPAQVLTHTHTMGTLKQN